MAGISVGGGGHGGKKSVDSEIPLVPFIDLLLCCIMFLLATAVWNQLARLNANQQTPGPPNPDQPPPPEAIYVVLRVSATGYNISGTDGRIPVDIAKRGDQWDLDALRTQLQTIRSNEPNRTDINVTSEDGVPYREVIATMDTALGLGFRDLRFQ